MLTTMRMAWLGTLWLAVLTVVAVVPTWALAAGGRVLTQQDSVSIKVVNQPDMDTTTRVESDGTISFPYVGRIRAAGLSEDQLAHTIERQLASRQIVGPITAMMCAPISDGAAAVILTRSDRVASDRRAVKIYASAVGMGAAPGDRSSIRKVASLMKKSLE